MTAAEIQGTLEGWFGPRVAVHAAVVGHFPLLPEESALIVRAVESRKAEFSTGRYCAHRALEALGGPADAILIGPRHGPVWPQSFTGAITHAAGIGAAVAARKNDIAGLGIDIVEAAAAARILHESASSIASPEELKFTIAGVDAAALVFSAKESAIKAISEIAGRYVDFPEIEIVVEGSRFQAKCPMLREPVQGWWRQSKGILLTAAVRSMLAS